MISKQLFILFLLLFSYLVPLNASKGSADVFGGKTPKRQHSRRQIPGICQLLNLNDGDYVLVASTTNDSTPVPLRNPNLGVNHLMPSPDEIPLPPVHSNEPEEPEEVPQGIGKRADGSATLPTHNNENHEQVSARFGGDQNLSTSCKYGTHQMPSKGEIHVIENVPRRFHNEFHTTITSLYNGLLHPKYVILGVTGCVAIGYGYSWWQQYRMRANINKVLLKYGKNLSMLSPTQALFIKAAYNKDVMAMQHYINHHDMKFLENADKAWSIPVLELLYSN